MIDFKKCAEETFANKIKNKFPVNDMRHEFSLLKGEIKELEDEVERFLHQEPFVGPFDNALQKEMADVAIFLINMAAMAGIDLEKAILDKIEYNKTRTYKKGTFTTDGNL